MMDKTKHKTPPKTFFRYLLDEYILFRRDFVIETAASIGTVEKQLRRLDNQKRGCLPRGTMGVTFNQVANTRHFVIAATRAQKRGMEQSAKAEGTIEHDDGVTVVTGNVVMSGYGYWIAIGIGLAQILYMLIVIDASGAVELSVLLLLSAVMLILPAVFWGLMYLDRNMLLEHIYAAIHKAESQTNPDKAKSKKSKELLHDTEQPLVNKAKR